MFRVVQLVSNGFEFVPSCLSLPEVQVVKMM